MRFMTQTRAVIFAAGALALATASTTATDLIGLNFSTSGAATPDPMNWTRISAADGSINNLQDENGIATNVNISWGANTGLGFVYLGTSSPLAADATPQYDYDLSGMTGYSFRSNADFFVEFSGLEPNEPYEFWFVAYRGGSNIDNLILVSDGDTVDASSFTQQIALANNDGRFIVNSTIADSSLQWNDLSLVTNSSSNGTIRFNWTVQSQTPVLAALAIRPASDPAPCVGDIADSNGTLGSPDGQVDFGDLLALLGLAGPCPGGTPGCTGDIADSNGTLGSPDGQVDFGDLLALLGLAGPCP
jgi:hypothetical protein